MLRLSNRWFFAFLLGLTLLAAHPAATEASYVLVADRLTNSVYRLTDTGAQAGIVLTDNVNLDEAVGIAVSPDSTKIYVASRLNNQVVQYDYDAFTGTASNPDVFADAADNLASPDGLLFNGNILYVSNQGGTGVAQFNLDGSSAGPAITGTLGGNTSPILTGLAYASTGELLVGNFFNATSSGGGVGKSDPAITSLTDLVDNPLHAGAAGLLVVGDDLYVTGLFAGTVARYDISDLNAPVLDNSFLIFGLGSPQGMMLSPDGIGFLVADLGAFFGPGGDGSILHYDFNGNLLGTFASGSLPGGFLEATAFVTVVPEPTTLWLLTATLASVGLVRWRRASATAQRETASNL